MEICEKRRNVICKSLDECMNDVLNWPYDINMLIGQYLYPSHDGLSLNLEHTTSVLRQVLDYIYFGKK